MRRSPAAALIGALVLGAAALVVVSQPISATAAAGSEPYRWKNVRIDGGGFVPGIVFNPGEKNLIYARTDIGGAHRWNQADKSWTPLLDWVGQDDRRRHGRLPGDRAVDRREVTVKNTGTRPVAGWSVRWTYAAGQTVAQVWGGTSTQSGSAVTVRNAAYNGTLAAGAATTFGFIGAGSANPVPAPVTCTASP